MGESEMKTYTICGSMRFEKEMREIAFFLETQRGHSILQCAYCGNSIVPTDAERENLEKAHYRKIDLSDGIYVVNIDGYIGQSVSQEIDYARRHGKEILYHCTPLSV